MNTTYDIEQVRHLSDIDLLRMFFGSDAEPVYRACAGKLQRVIRETPQTYCAGSRTLHAANELITRALHQNLLSEPLSDPSMARDYLKYRCFGLEYEVFLMMSLTAQGELIAVDELFRGTLTQTEVYPREVVKRALRLNAGAVIVAHNHPSGSVLPSDKDQAVTEKLRDALKLIDVQLLDHFIVAGNGVFSMAEEGLL